MSYTDEQKKFWREWIDALRSGNFPQGRMRLKEVVSGGYCCLGVGCEVKGEGTFVAPDNFFEININGEDKKWESEPNWSVYSDWLGINPASRFDHPLHTEEDNGGWQPDTFVDICMTLNDDAEWDFDEIADWIEQLAIDQGVFDA